MNGHKHITTVLDPFSGTGTTALSAAYRGLTGTGLEINPFLVWFSSIKFRKYSTDTIEKTQSLGDEIADTTSSSELTVDPPPIHNIERWWNKRELYFLCRLKACILDTTDDGSPERDLLLATFCRVVILLSNAAFNHQSMSFKNVNHAPTLFEIKRDFPDVFRTELSIVLNGAMDNPCIEPTVVTGDARQPSRFLNNTYDMIITSPPYPNRMSYIRELRPYMYWMDFLTNGRDAGEFDWQAIGGTWGIATSRLAEWEPGGNYFIPGSLEKSLKGISDPRNDNGRLMANYVAKYFEDMWRHISDVSTILNPDSEIHYIVGNSTFYNT
ncbi:MAG: hypothetical protein JW849_10530, partial [Phycisphaerae bacterium]|nr:hypothetical protein [Phycisphaerae bacterium]